MKTLGAKILIISSAVGSVNPECKSGELVLVKDHINLMGVNPLIGPNDESLGPRFPDMYETYNHTLLDLAERVAQQRSIKVHRGVYAAMTGPNLETPSEYRYLRTIGADVVGMSMVPEALVGIHSGLKILGITVVTDLATPETLKPSNIKEIIEIAQSAEPKMTSLVKGLLARLDEIKDE
jgi:purine-nucleoside phosphorylase